MNKNILKHVIRYLLVIAIILLCYTIFKFSDARGQKSSKTSTEFTKILINLFENNKNMSEEEKYIRVESIQPLVRKGAHFCLYMLLGILTMLCAQTFNWCKAYKCHIYTSICKFRRNPPTVCAGKKWTVYRCLLGYGSCYMWNSTSNANNFYSEQDKIKRC